MRVLVQLIYVVCRPINSISPRSQIGSVLSVLAQLLVYAVCAMSLLFL